MKEGNKNKQILLEETKVMQSWKPSLPERKHQKSATAAGQFINKDLQKKPTPIISASIVFTDFCFDFDHQKTFDIVTISHMTG